MGSLGASEKPKPQSKAHNKHVDNLSALTKDMAIVQELHADLERYQLFYGELPATYGKVDVMTAYRTYREKESFHQNFGRYLEALKAKLEVTDMQLKDVKAKKKVNSEAQS